MVWPAKYFERHSNWAGAIVATGQAAQLLGAAAMTVTPGPEGTVLSFCLESRWPLAASHLQNHTSPSPSPALCYLNSCPPSSLRTTEFKRRHCVFQQDAWLRGEGVDLQGSGWFFYTR